EKPLERIQGRGTEEGRQLSGGRGRESFLKRNRVRKRPCAIVAGVRHVFLAFSSLSRRSAWQHLPRPQASQPSRTRPARPSQATPANGLASSNSRSAASTSRTWSRS